MSRSDTISHEQARDLLPWLVNDSLGAEERDMVAAHARSCINCRRDLAELEKLRDSIAVTADHANIPAPDMRRINARIDALIETENRPRELLAKAREFLLSPWRIAFVAQTALLVVLGIVFVWPQAQDAEFTTLSDPAPDLDGDYIRIVFDPYREPVELAALVEDMDLVIVDGPSSRGVATLRIPKSVPPTERDEMISILLENPGILFAEPVVTVHER